MADPTVFRETQTGGSPAVWIGVTDTIWLHADSDMGDGLYDIPAGSAIGTTGSAWWPYDEDESNGVEVAHYITLERVNMWLPDRTRTSKPVLVMVLGACRVAGCWEAGASGPIALAAAGQADFAKISAGGTALIYFVT
jgi:hypothetical protein